LRNGEIIDDSFLDLEQVGIIVPGQANNLNNAIDPLLGNEYSTLGETPNNITLTITYRVGGGLNSNVPSQDLTTGVTTVSSITPSIDGGARLLNVTNNFPAVGGKNQEDTIEIKEKAKAFFSTQNRCVTKEDYEARVLNIPAKFGNIAKVYVSRPVTGDVSPETSQQFSSQLSNNTDLLNAFRTKFDTSGAIISGASGQDLYAIPTQLVDELNQQLDELRNGLALLTNYNDLTVFSLHTIDIYTLAYDNSKQLVGNPHVETTGGTNNLPLTLTSNIKNYLQNFKLMTDVVSINDGYIINFGVIFDIISEKYANKQKVKLDCIEKIKDYFKIEKMQFNQPIFKSQLEFELMGVEGVRSIGHVTITQKNDYLSDANDSDLPNATYTFSKDSEDNFVDSSLVENGGAGTAGYGYKYDFEVNLSDDGTIILPAETSTPAVFELKNPNQNIQGRVR